MIPSLLLAIILTGILGPLDQLPANAQAEPTHYKIRNIGVLEGDTGSFLTAINEDGVAVGLSIKPDNAGNHAVTYRDGELRDLSGGDESASTAWAINQSGQTVGFFADPPEASGAALWDGDEMAVLPKLGGDTAQAFGINDDGIVVGASNTSPGGPVRACRWENGEVTELPSASDGSIGNAINSKGQIAGSSGSHATLWDGGKITDLGVLGGTTSLGRAINDAGQIVGHSTTTENGTFGSDGTHAFLWADGQMTDLGSLPGSDLSFAWDINADSIIAGSAGDPDAANNPNPVKLLAVIWVDGEIVNLNDLIPPDSDWVLTTAYGINDTGQIVGYGYNKGRQRGFILTPEEA
jgi:probable HAF family extracellular repeat protein